MSSDFQFVWQGHVSYQEGLRLQNASPSGTILGLEHPLTVTFGKRCSEEDRLVSRQRFQNQECEFFDVERGGQVTLHSPGQLVIYPVIEISLFGGVRAWVETLQKVTQSVLGRLGIPAQTSSESGLWTEQGKIAFVGIRVKKGVSFHGLSINIHNDLKLFEGLESCGVRNAAMDSCLARNVSLSTQKVFELWSQEFQANAPKRD